MAFTYSKLAEVTLASSASTATLANIPQNYNDLKIVASVRCDRASVDTEAYISFNGTTTGYSYRVVGGNGASASSATASTYPPIVINAANSTASTFSNSEFYIPNYRSSVAKSISSDSLSENNATTANTYLVAGLWNNTTAITSITLTPFTGSFVTNSTFTLYGVKAEV